MKDFKRIIGFILFFCLLVGCTDTAPIESVEVEQFEQFSGVVVAVKWQKSSESYCQGGSDYYVLDTETERLMLNSFRDSIHLEDDYAAFETMQGELQTHVGQTVTVMGELITEMFSEDEHCPDPMMQCIAGSIRCTWLRVVKVE